MSFNQGWLLLAHLQILTRFQGLISSRRRQVQRAFPMAKFKAQFDGSQCRIRGFGPSWPTACNGGDWLLSF